MRFFNRASIRTKFVLLPLVATGFLLILLSIFASFLGAEKRLLTQIKQENIVKVDLLLDLFAQLSRNHAHIFSLLLIVVFTRR